MSGQRVVRPADMPRQRGHHTSVPDSGRDGRTDRVLARPAGRPSGRPTSPRPVRRAPLDWSGIADTVAGFWVVVLVVAATVVAIGVVGAAVMGF